MPTTMAATRGRRIRDRPWSWPQGRSLIPAAGGAWNPEPVTAPAPARPRLTRASDGRALGGVAAGVAEHLGLSPLVIRIAFLLLALSGGVGIAMYAALWVFTPQAEGVRPVDA